MGGLLATAADSNPAARIGIKRIACIYTAPSVYMSAVQRVAYNLRRLGFVIWG